MLPAGDVPRTPTLSCSLTFGALVCEPEHSLLVLCLQSPFRELSGQTPTLWNAAISPLPETVQCSRLAGWVTPVSAQRRPKSRHRQTRCQPRRLPDTSTPRRGTPGSFQRCSNPLLPPSSAPCAREDLASLGLVRGIFESTL